MEDLAQHMIQLASRRAHGTSLCNACRQPWRQAFWGLQTGSRGLWASWALWHRPLTATCYSLRSPSRPRSLRAKKCSLRASSLPPSSLPERISGWMVSIYCSCLEVLLMALRACMWAKVHMQQHRCRPVMLLDLSGVSLKPSALQCTSLEPGVQACYWLGLGWCCSVLCSVAMGGGAVRLYVPLGG